MPPRLEGICIIIRPELAGVISVKHEWGLNDTYRAHPTQTPYREIRRLERCVQKMRRQDDSASDLSSALLYPFQDLCHCLKQKISSRIC